MVYLVAESKALTCLYNIVMLQAKAFLKLIYLARFLMTFQIPKEFQPGVKKLLTLDEEKINNLVAVFNEPPSKLSIRDLASSISSKISSIPIQDLTEILRSLVAMYQVRPYLKLSTLEFAEEIYKTIESGNYKDLAFQKLDKELVKSRLVNFLSLQLLGLISKAQDVLAQQQHLYTDARILTDIRSIFDNDNPEQPIAGAIIHTLKIHYIEGGVHKDIYLALDTKDIRQLRETLDRAEVKAKSLKSLFEKASLPYLDID